ncbi:MAG: glyceraldehyde-3-phosphate dehydrogenase [Caldimicrobium sp.]|nr:glyceraldehyde-3-phosphate dehydrogenase [Caldimicrobium sp.]MCX7874129.1 glyceraldehyde-3-phosphate dehydrogenase [Caldimicrobium sp.]MDW8093736.1 glyceraldehyde 3-phosphate dehydrogenase NAD-binding domain-containing protein [Caldimicrobium sp.]
MKLGINGLGRIGKLTLWHHVARKYFSEIVVNLGREVGTSFTDIAEYVEKDSTYGWLPVWLYGHRAKRVIENLDEKEGTMYIDGVKVKFLRKNRNPKDIEWREEGVRLVVDCTGKFRDPTIEPDNPKGSARGHLLAGAEKVIISAPFKVKNKDKALPEDTITLVYGINEESYQPEKHHIISSASCTTTCLAYMVKPLIDYFGPERILSASMVTVHATTSSQSILDRVPKEAEKDLRRARSVFNNIILTSTGAAEALALVIPEMKKIGFMAESVRVPLTTGSLIILTVNIQDESIENHINRDLINQIYKEASATKYKDYLLFSMEQNVSTDIIGYPKAAAIIEGRETHTRTAIARVDLHKACGNFAKEEIQSLSCSQIEIPITQVVVYGWYDNELASYTHLMGDLTVFIAEKML